MEPDPAAPSYDAEKDTPETEATTLNHILRKVHVMAGETTITVIWHLRVPGHRPRWEQRMAKHGNLLRSTCSCSTSATGGLVGGGSRAGPSADSLSPLPILARFNPTAPADGRI
ncbi:hypothetical protein GCM10027405_02840 [Arthrobacter alkaliphilus]